MGIIGGYEKMSLIRDARLKNILPGISDVAVKWYCTYPQSFKNDMQIKDIRDFLHHKLA